MWTNG